MERAQFLELNKDQLVCYTPDAGMGSGFEGANDGNTTMEGNGVHRQESKRLAWF
jgi:hypothetical protein